MKEVVEENKIEKKRESNIELYRIVLMLLIIAHHYVVNSGLLAIMYENPLSGKSIFLFLFGAWGKIGINCFLLITGYFMCKSKTTITKFIKLLLEVKFYRIVVYLIFCLTGYTTFEMKLFMKSVLPITSVAQNFTGCFLLFYLLIPYINKLIENLNKKEFEKLILLIFIIYSVFGNINMPGINVVINYITLYTYIYFIGAYIRLYPMNWFSNKKIVNLVTIGLLFTCVLSIIFCLYTGKEAYYYVIDSNKILAVLTSISLFLCFKNMNIKYNKTINTIASSIFGVLLIHANSDIMRRFLWITVFKNIKMYYSNYLYIHAIVSVIGVFIICVILDQIRIKFIEKPFFDRVLSNKEKKD